MDACREELKKTLIDLHSDAVLVNTMTSVPAMLAAVELDLPSLLWVHGVIDSLLLPGRSSEFAAVQDALLLHSATRVIALPNYTAEFCTRVMHRTALDIIPNWTQVDRQFAVPQDKYCSRQIACLNTFDAHKGHATLIEAAALLNARNVSFELKLYGDGPLRDTWQRQIGASGLQDCVRFPGRTTDVEQVYDQSLCVVNPADAEPFPMTLIEPLARKTPVVATRSAGRRTLWSTASAATLSSAATRPAWPIDCKRCWHRRRQPKAWATAASAGLFALQRGGCTGRFPAAYRRRGP